ncbi:MAG: flagellar export protein FliJ [Candidatus Lindowbacteria bacterium]|nr:flagellar export protein FliJ [Candidatus Lindowbacteria bacterium]
MKAYKFRFESVLKSKKIIVDDLSSKTARAHRILMLEMRKLDDLKERETQCVRELIRQQVGRVNAAEVQRSHRYLELLGKSISEQSKKVAEIAKRVEMLRNMLVEAQKQKKIFEKLDEKERDEFYRDFLKKEQALLDEVGVNRFVQRSAHRRIHSSG